MWLYRWDEWVHPARLLKLNDTNLALQKTLMQANAAATASASGSAAAAKAGVKGHPVKDVGRTTTRKDGGGTRGTKRNREEVCVSAVNFLCQFRRSVPSMFRYHTISQFSVHSATSSPCTEAYPVPVVGSSHMDIMGRLFVLYRVIWRSGEVV